MSALGKFQASLNSVTQETSVALANLNVDLSLFKVEAPPEYRELGVALSRRQRAAAEDGPPHTTARRLGSLFQSIIPETPCLIRAYGQRASEIAQSPESNPKGTVEDGPFRDFVGANGTSIWAAATSGPAAIAAHLLACMLASVWTAEEAVAIWEEIISERKRRLEATSADASFTRIEDAVATRLEISREQITVWDASARSWLKVAADAPAVRDRQHTIRSALKTVNASVNPRVDVFTSVTEAWKTALETMEKVICGASYSVQDGAVIIALLCWHLYPDFVILGSTQTEGTQRDPLVRTGGVITIGLTGTQGPGDQPGAQPGVHWSLSLGHMRFYGRKMDVRRSATADDGRVTFDEFVVILLGALVGLWTEEESIRREDALGFIQTLLRHVDAIVEKRGIYVEYIRENSWFTPLLTALQRCLNAGPEDERTRKLFDLGVRRQRSLRVGGGRFLGSVLTENLHAGSIRAIPVYERRMSPQNRLPFRVRLFGLDENFIETLPSIEDRRACIDRFVRKSAIRRAVPGRPVFFIFGQLEPEDLGGQDSSRVFLRNSTTARTPPRYRATLYYAIHRGRAGGAAKDDVEEIPIKSAELDDKGYVEECTFFWERPPARIRTLLREHGAKRGRGEVRGKRAYTFRIFDLGRTAMNDGFFLLDSGSKLDDNYLTMISDRSEVLQWIQSGKVNDKELLHLWSRSGLVHHLKGLSSFSRMHRLLPDLTLSTAMFFANPMVGSAPPGLGSPSGLFRFFRQLADGSPNVVHPNHPTFVEVYGRLQRSTQFLVPFLHRTQAFAVLAVFHTGNVSLSPGGLNNSFAMSIENSLYIAAPVVSDPASDLIPHDIRVVRGTTGKPGISLLGFNSNVNQTEVRQTNADTWQVVNHEPFDGKLEDSFKGTSLHLRFTGYEHSEVIGSADGGSRFTGITHLEALVSTHERGTWVGDIEPSHVLDAVPFCPVVALPGCPGEAAGTAPPVPLVSIENWEELLDPPANAPGVFKAHGNWQARLAAACLCSRLGYMAIVFKDHGCWKCAFSTMSAARGKPPLSGYLPPPMLRGHFGYHLVPAGRWSPPKEDDTDSESDVSDSTSSASSSRSASPARYSEDAEDKKSTKGDTRDGAPEPTVDGDDDQSDASSSSDSDDSEPPFFTPMQNKKVIFII